MKTIFRQLNMGLILASIIALGAVAGFAQDPCADAEGQGKLYELFREQFPKKTTIDDQKATINTGKQFLEKYGSCEATKESSDYLKTTIPVLEKNLAARIERERFDAILKKFNDGLKTSNWADVYDAGKQILSEKPDEFRDAELVLGSIGLGETAKNPRVTKWNEDTLKYAKLSIQDLEANKPFKTYGVSIKDGANFQYKNKEDALAWMNYTIGYIYFYDKANKKEALSYLYKASQSASDTKSNPALYQAIGSYYFDEVKKLAGEVDALVKTQDPKDTEEVAKQKVEAIKAKVAMVNGTAEAAIDAYARAYHLAKASTTVKKEYTDGLFKTMQDLYNVRFGKTDGFDAFVAQIDKKPLPNPLNPVAPIRDPEPVTTPATATNSPDTPGGSGMGTPGGKGLGTPSGTGLGTPSGTGTGTKPAGSTTTTKPATTPVKKPGAQPQAVVKKPVVKKKGA